MKKSLLIFVMCALITLSGCMGRKTLEETKAPNGYLINDELYVRTITTEGAAEYVDTFGYDHILKAKEDEREIRLTNRYISRMGILVVKK